MPRFYPAATSLGIPRARAQGREGRARAFRQGARAAAATRLARSSGADRRCWRSNGTATRWRRSRRCWPSIRARPKPASTCGRAEVPRARAGNRARARGGARPAGSTRPRTRTERRLPVNRTAAFLYRELAVVERRQGHDEPALEHFRRAVELDPSDARSLVHDRRDSREPGGFRGGACRRTSPLRRSTRVPRSRRGSTRCGTGSSSRSCRRSIGRSSRRRRSRARILRRSWAIRLGQLLQNAPSRRRGPHHRHQEQLGADLDRRRGARRRHGAVREPRVPAARDRPPRRPRAGHREAARARSASSQPAAAKSVGVRTPALQRSRADAPGVSGRVDGGRRERAAGGPGDTFQPSRADHRRGGRRDRRRSWRRSQA